MTECPAPTVSVLLAVYNAEKYVEAAVRSVLNQTFRDLEVILIDDGSSDASLPILQRLAAADDRIRLVTRPNKGIPATANEMISLARGRYLSLMDHDDIKLPDCVAREVAYLDAHPECVAVGSVSNYIDDKGHVTKVKRNLSILFTKVSRRSGDLDGFPPDIPSLSNPSAMVRADAMRKAGCYRFNMPYAHDTDLWFRLARLGQIHRLNEVLLHYRIHATNTTVQHRALIVQYEVVAILSAIARHHGLDDEALISGFRGVENFDATREAYKALIGSHYSVETFLLYRAIGSRIPALVGDTDMPGLLARVNRHVAAKPLTVAKIKLMRRAIGRML